jgi:hypothetical protein
MPKALQYISIIPFKTSKSRRDPCEKKRTSLTNKRWEIDMEGKVFIPENDLELLPKGFCDDQEQERGEGTSISNPTRGSKETGGRAIDHKLQRRPTRCTPLSSLWLRGPCLARSTLDE